LKNTQGNKASRKPNRKNDNKPERAAGSKPERKPKPEYKSDRKPEFKPDRKPEFKPDHRLKAIDEGQDKPENTGIIIGRNAVIEALKADREIEKIMVSGTGEGSIKKIIAMASDKGIPIHYSEKVALDRAADGENHQGVVASVSAAPNVDIEDILAYGKSRGEEPFLIILDGIEDPHNLGAIIRTAECAGAHGVVLPKRRAAGITEVVSKTSAGAVEYMRCARVPNIAQTIEKLKSQGVWIAACDMDGTDLYQSNLKGALAIVVGGEGKGLSKLVKEKCDFIVSIPIKGHINSLNASNAAAVVLYEATRQRDGK
jgi:23S rRNA (guanosine2251-2'-O)-methyltransferase